MVSKSSENICIYFWELRQQRDIYKWLLQIACLCSEDINFIGGEQCMDVCRYGISLLVEQ